MKSPGRRFAEIVSAMVIGWLAASLVLALVKGEAVRLLSTNSSFDFAIIGALLFGAGLRYIVDTVSARKSRG